VTPTLSAKARAFWLSFSIVWLLDFVTKRLAEHYLWTSPPVRVLGDFLRFSLGHNPHGAMGMSFGSASRIVFSVLAVVMLALLWNFYRQSPQGDRVRAAALGLVSGGALGNLVDRWRSPLGVVDFIDIGIGQLRFWTFNVADTALTCGGIVLAVVLFKERPK